MQRGCNLTLDINKVVKFYVWHDEMKWEYI